MKMKYIGVFFHSYDALYFLGFSIYNKSHIFHYNSTSISIIIGWLVWWMRILTTSSHLIKKEWRLFENSWELIMKDVVSITCIVINLLEEYIGLELRKVNCYEDSWKGWVLYRSKRRGLLLALFISYEHMHKLLFVNVYVISKPEMCFH